MQCFWWRYQWKFLFLVHTETRLDKCYNNEEKIASLYLQQQKIAVVFCLFFSSYIFFAPPFTTHPYSNY